MSRDEIQQATERFIAAVTIEAGRLSEELVQLAAERAKRQVIASLQPELPFPAQPPEKTKSAPKPKSNRTRFRPGAKISNQSDLDRIVAFVKKHPGMRIEMIRARLGTEADITPALATGRIVRKGVARATRYYPGKKA